MDAEDGNYFLNCRSNDGNVSSGIAYYKNLVPGQMLDKIPDDYVEVSRGGNIDWETVSSGPSSLYSLSLSCVTD